MEILLHTLRENTRKDLIDTQTLNLSQAQFKLADAKSLREKYDKRLSEIETPLIPWSSSLTLTKQNELLQLRTLLLFPLRKGNSARR